METQERIEDDSMAKKSSDGKDELNLAEFPLCALAHRLQPDQKTLRFEDRVGDARCRETITRQLTITGSDAYGLAKAKAGCVGVSARCRVSFGKDGSIFAFIRAPIWKNG